MTVGDEVVKRLSAEGVETIFGIPGKQTLPLNKAMNEFGIEFVMARHETAVSHNAWGYAESSGEVAGTVVIPGPGDMNAMNGLKNALNDCTPLIHIAVETEPEVRGGDGIHETPPDTYDNVVKENYLVEEPQAAAPIVAEAVRTARTAPKGPVRVGIPKNFLTMDVPQAAPSDTTPPKPRQPDVDAVDTAASLLADADEPVIVIGGGVRASGATDSLLALAERLSSPVLTTYKGKGGFPEDHPLSAGVLCGGTSPEVAEVLAESDVALAVGTDFDAVSTGQWSLDVPEDLIHVTLDPNDIGTGYEPSVALVADADTTLSMLSDEVPQKEGTGAERARTARNSDENRIKELIDGDEPPLTSPTALRSVRSAISEDTIVTADAGGFRLWTLVSFPAFGPRSYVNPGSWATMGTGLPSAIGAKTANPDSDVVALTGDGGLLMCVHELHTLAAENIDVTVVVFANQDYAIISEEAERSYGLEDMTYGWPRASLSFDLIAEGMGIEVMNAETSTEIEETVAEAVESEGPTLVEVPTDPTEPQASEWMTRPQNQSSK
ncbi:thiamine pyrophosphate-binding protein [Halobacterium sp. CBA1126]|uniref:thiamine pyrophosphate-binding protein n=1 Tax=Halobacterium sp. CBA1126 TaxID=2668074 RepID=UPI0012F9C580|nr:thiamine pyrophosphate-binding protein [Halobacterium sp. CBA1126]MUV60237.1 thiamine pyrophosphate-binding protein [Halobacterium sp. CBA1126]